MANIVVVVDTDVERRDAFVARVRRIVAPVEGLEVAHLVAGDLAVIWAADPRAPVSVAARAAPATLRSGQYEGADEGPAEAAIVWGDAIPDAHSGRLDGAGLLREWAPHGNGGPPAYDGFHAALRYDAITGLRFGGDVLGFFPVYYAQAHGVLMAGSSPELFAHHPLFPPVLDPAGLAGILRLHALPPHRALLRGVRRLAAGRVLSWRPGEAPRELPQYSIPVSARRTSRSFEDDVRELDDAFARATARHTGPDERIGILLSGGRDSRQLAGYLHERGVGLEALTFGVDSDHEWQCARAVALELGCKQRTQDLEVTDFVDGAVRQARWEHLGAGFASIHMWGAIRLLRELPNRVVTGHLRSVGELEPMPPLSGERLPDEPGRGIPSVTLRRLLRPAVFGAVIDDLSRCIRAEYEAGCPLEAERPWRWFLAYGCRSHAGAVPWRLSFGSWPVLPILDRQVLAVIATLPESTLANRRAQDAILRLRFPALAQLPIDRNSHDTLPLLPTMAQRVLHRAGRVAAPLRRRLPGRREQRYYHRIYDINGPGWRAVRRLAEPHRDRLASLMDMDVLSTLVPPPSVRIGVEHNIRDTFGTKLLIGLMLWSAEHPV